jgi:hypothetical protein
MGRQGGPREGTDQGPAGRRGHRLDQCVSQGRHRRRRPGTRRLVPPAEGAAARQEQGRAVRSGSRPRRRHPSHAPQPVRHPPHARPERLARALPVRHPASLRHPAPVRHPAPRHLERGLLGPGQLRRPGQRRPHAHRLRRAAADPHARRTGQGPPPRRRRPRHGLLPALLVRRRGEHQDEAGQAPDRPDRSPDRPRAARRPDRSVRRLGGPDRRARHVHHRSGPPGLSRRRDPVVAGGSRRRSR